MKKEEEKGNTRVRFVTSNKYYAPPQRFDRENTERYCQNLFAEAREVIQEAFYSFIIIEVEGSEQQNYNKLTELATANGYEFYAIDVNQDFEVSLKYCKHARAYKDIEKICNEVSSSPVAYYHKLLDPIELVAPGWKVSQPPPTEPPKPAREEPRQKKTSSGNRRYYDDDSDEQCFTCHG